MHEVTGHGGRALRRGPGGRAPSPWQPPALTPAAAALVRAKWSTPSIASWWAQVVQSTAERDILDP
jgi:hypothetical protein